MFKELKNNKELITFIKNNKELVQKLLTTHEIKEVDYQDDIVKSIIKAFLDLNAENQIKYTIDNQLKVENVYNNINIDEIFKVLDDNQALILVNKQNDIYIVKAKGKLVFIAESLECLKI